MLFFKHVLSWVRDNDIHVGTLNESDLFFGKFDIKEDFISVNLILLLGNRIARLLSEVLSLGQVVFIPLSSILPGRERKIITLKISRERTPSGQVTA